MAEQVLRVSPLGRYEARFAALDGGDRIAIREVPFLTQLTLRVQPAGAAADRIGKALGVALPVQPCTTASGDGVTVLWLGPDEWLVVSEPDRAADLTARIRENLAGEHGAVVDTSAQRTAVRITGKNAADVLAHGCALDLDRRGAGGDGVAISGFGPGQCVSTLLAKAQVVITPEQDGYLVLVRSSFAEYLATWLLDASAEYAAGAADELERVG